MLNRFFAALVLTILGAGIFALLSVKLHLAMEKADARRDFREASAEKAELLEERARLQARLSELARNTRAVEAAIRTHYRMVRPGERVTLVEHSAGE